MLDLIRLNILKWKDRDHLMPVVRSVALLLTRAKWPTWSSSRCMPRKTQTTLIIVIITMATAMGAIVAPTAQQPTPPRNQTEVSIINLTRRMNQAMLLLVSLASPSLSTRSKGTVCSEACASRVFLSLGEAAHGHTSATWSTALKTCSWRFTLTGLCSSLRPSALQPWFLFTPPVSRFLSCLKWDSSYLWRHGKALK